MQVLRLTEPQGDQLLELRKVHLRNLRELFEDRQRLNLQVSLGCSFSPPRRGLTWVFDAQAYMAHCDMSHEDKPALP